MDFEDTPAEREFRASVRLFLGAQTDFLAACAGPARGSAAANTDVGVARQWQQRKAAAGFAGILLPAAFGGRGGSVMEQIILDQEEAQAGAPPDVHFMVGMGICAPTLVRFGTAEQQQRYLPPLVRGDEIWCQLFSEPSGGSDLAGVRTRARRDGEGWVVSGQKIWTSGAQHADFGLLLARTDPDVAKHKGLTAFIVDMRAPGVTVRPIRQISGSAHFNEVFLDDVAIADRCRVGAAGGGWDVALGMLMNERLTVGRALSPDVGGLIRLAHRTEMEGRPAIANGMVRERLAQWYCEQRGVQHTISRVMTALSKGREPGPEASIIKIVDAVREFDMASFALDLLGPCFEGQDGSGADTAIEAFLEAPGTRIGGGTEEILLNVIAERVLRLPGDVRVDKDVAFRDLPR